jgi:iron complex transport system substrate-binding protein
MRIVSLLPSTTEIAYALDLGAQVVGVTHECDWPPAVRGTPVVTSSALPDKGASSAEIDEIVSSQRGEQISIYHLDHALLRQLQPDLILTQALCDVCAVSFDTVQAAVRDLGGSPRILSLEPTTLEGIFETISSAGEATGKQSTAAAVVDELRQRVAQVQQRVQVSATDRPRVACLEWLDPVFGPGHWLPELVELAGGEPGLGTAGAPSRRVEWDEVLEFAPEVLVLSCCGFNVARTTAEAQHILPQRSGWHDLPAVQNGRVYAVDGNAYFSRPGPRIVESLELLAYLLHPALFSDWSGSDAREHIRSGYQALFTDAQPVQIV